MLTHTLIPTCREEDAGEGWVFAAVCSYHVECLRGGEINLRDMTLAYERVN